MLEIYVILITIPFVFVSQNECACASKILADRRAPHGLGMKCKTSNVSGPSLPTGKKPEFPVRSLRTWFRLSVQSSACTDAQLTAAI